MFLFHRIDSFGVSEVILVLYIEGNVECTENARNDSVDLNERLSLSVEMSFVNMDEFWSILWVFMDWSLTSNARKGHVFDFLKSRISIYYVFILRNRRFRCFRIFISSRGSKCRLNIFQEDFFPSGIWCFEKSRDYSPIRARFFFIAKKTFVRK